ncbi:hypothetical protein [Larsenimonas suaedae]|nr:hypothetical protein [Larsenimonas suaedae]MCM2973808.1 hypothetical protein [Larsenimonas suaedae]
MLWMDGWNTQVPMDKNDPLNRQFMLAVADGLGVSTDKQQNEKSLADLDETLATPAIQSGLDALTKVFTGEAFDSQDQKAVATAVDAAGENMHSLDALTSLAQYRLAESRGAGTFTSHLMRETDGVTNGPMLSLLQLGAAESADALLETLNKGGFFQVGSDFKQYGHWRSQKAHQDLYESTTAAFMAKVEDAQSGGDPRPYRAIMHFTGELSNNAGITKAGRNIIKKPLTAMMFGSSIPNAIDGMADEFVDKIYQSFEKAANTSNQEDGQKQAHVALRAINRLLVNAGRNDLMLNDRLTTEQMLATTLTPHQVKALKDQFTQVIGKQVEDAMNEKFTQFMEDRSVLNKAAQTAFDLYEMVYQRRRAQKIDALKADGSLATNAKGTALHELTPAQEKELRDSLKALEPVVHTPFSKQDDNLAAGILLAKTHRALSDNPALMQNVVFSRQIGRTENGSAPTKSLSPRGYEMARENPGVAGLIMDIHSTDSAISAASYSKLPALNVHDANGFGLTDVSRGSRNLNQATFETLMNFSVPSEMTEALVRTVSELHAMKDEIASDDVLRDAYRGLEKKLRDGLDEKTLSRLSRKGKDAVWYTLNAAAGTAVRSDRTKLDVLSKLAYVDQYAMEGGNYAVSEQDRDTIKKKLEDVDNRAYSDALKMAAELGALMLRQGAATDRKAESPKNEEQDNNESASRGHSLSDTAKVTAVLQSLTQEKHSALVQARDAGSPITNKQKQQIRNLRQLSKEIARTGNLDSALEAVFPGNKNQARRNAWKKRLANYMSDTYAGTSGVAQLPSDMYLDTLDLAAEQETLNEDLAEDLEFIHEKVVRGKLTSRDAAKKFGTAAVTSELNKYAGSSHVTPWGEIGYPAIDSDPDLIEFFEATPETTVSDVIDHLTKRAHTENNAFQVELLGVLKRAVDPAMAVHYITATNYPPRERVAEPLSKARGWYESSVKGEALYIKSPDYLTSGVTQELLIHELTHAALAQLVEEELDTRSLRDTPSSIAPLVDDLETLRKKAEATIKQSPELERKYAHSVVNVHELMAWGMSNQGFQQDVLSKVGMQSRTRKNEWVTGVKAMIQRLVGILFQGTSLSRQKVATTGLSVLVSNTSGLLNAAAHRKISRMKRAAHPMQDAEAQQATEGHYPILAILGQSSDGRLGFMDHLDDVYTEIAKVYGPFGMERARLASNPAIRAEDVFMQSLQRGEAPFASESLAAGLPLQDHEAMVAELSEAVIRESLTSSPAAYQKLRELFNEARQRLSARDFHEGDWDSATQDEQDEAQRRYDFVFGRQQNADKTSDYLSRFASLGLSWGHLNDALKFTSPSTQAEPVTLADKLLATFRKIMDHLFGRMLDLDEGRRNDKRMEHLVRQLVNTEAKKRRRLSEELTHKKRPLQMALETSTKVLSEQTRDALYNAGNSVFFKQGKNGFLRFTGSLTSLIASDRVAFLMDGVNRLRDQTVDKRHGLLAGMVNEVRGANETNQFAHTLLREANSNEQQRMQIIMDASKLVRESFANEGKDLTREDKAALSQTVLRADMAALLDHYSMNELTHMMGNPEALDEAIDEFSHGLRSHGELRHYYLRSAKDLAFYMATGKNRSPNLMMNAHNIAHLVGTQKFGSVSESQAQDAIKLLDPLVSLLAIKYSPSAHKARALNVMRSELARGREGGVEMLVRLHKQMQQEAFERNFGSEPVHFAKGYTREIYNPYKDIVAATPAEGRNLERMGWSRSEQALPKDKADPEQEERFLYTVRDGGLRSHVTGIFSYTGQRARGSLLHGGVSSVDSDAPNYWNVAANRKIEQGKRGEIDRLFKLDSSYDPTRARDTHMAPVINRAGEVVNYRYLMSHNTKDTLLERNNDFDEIMGSMAGSVFDKAASKDLNAKAVQAMFDQYNAEYASRPESYMALGPNSTDSDLRETWRLMPDETKKAVKEIWGSNQMMVRKDLMDITFGYRKYSLATMFEKKAEHRNAMEKIFTGFLEAILGKKAALRVRRAEDVWQEIVKETKDILVVKSGITLLGNISSNLWQLYAMGVPFKDMVRNHREAIEGVLAYRRDRAELDKLKRMRAAEYVDDGTESIDQRIVELEDSIARNPVKELIDAGMLQTIVEDIDMHQDEFSYMSLLSRKTERWTSRLPDSVSKAGRALYMAHDTPLYKLLSQTTQLSDFVARYVLHEYQTTRQDNPMSKTESLDMATEAFVNYDVPTPRTLQYLNDMGVVWFTKYYLRIQKVIARMFREQPARSMSLLLLERFFPDMPTLMDSDALSRLGNNPLSEGALKYPDSLGELATLATIGKVI